MDECQVSPSTRLSHTTKTIGAQIGRQQYQDTLQELYEPLEWKANDTPVYITLMTTPPTTCP